MGQILFLVVPVSLLTQFLWPQSCSSSLSLLILHRGGTEVLSNLQMPHSTKRWSWDLYPGSLAPGSAAVPPAILLSLLLRQRVTSPGRNRQQGRGRGLGLGEGITSSHCGMKASDLGQYTEPSDCLDLIIIPCGCAFLIQKSVCLFGGFLCLPWFVSWSQPSAESLAGDCFHDCAEIPKFWSWLILFKASLVAQTVKHLPTMRETWVRSLGGENLLEKEMATHSSTLAWKIPWEEPGRLQSMGLQRVGQDWATSLHFTSILFKCLWRPSVLRVLKCSLKKEKGKKSLKATVRGLASVHQYEVTSMITELSSER